MKYPIGIQTFEQIREGGFVYVDKTALVYKLATEGKIYFLSRPRRFGKSLLLSTLKNYFLGNEEVFRGLAIEKLETEWATYPVFHMDFNGSNFTLDGTLEEFLEGRVRTWEAEWGTHPYSTAIADRLAYVFHQAHEKTGQRVVVLIDEYDKPLLDVIDLDKYGVRDGNRDLLENIHREVLKGLYSVFKAADADLRFVFLTGVTKFSQVSVFSGFNQLKDISMDPTYATLCGITDEELGRYFSEQIRPIATRYKVSEEEMLRMLRRQYDGYHFCADASGVYNPFSLLNCLDQQMMYDFWFASGTPTYLVRLLQNSDVNINEIIRAECRAAAFMDSKAVHAEPLPMIYQSGYLTIKSFNLRRNTYRLDFPNKEVRVGFMDVIAGNYFKRPNIQSSWIEAVTDALEAGDTEKFRLYLTRLLATVTYRFQEKHDPIECERYFQLTFYLILQMVGTYTVYAERETSEGRIDCVVETDDFVYIIEVKRDGTAEAALAQIAQRGYAKPYAADKRRVIALGINFSSQTGNVDGFLTKAA